MRKGWYWPLLLVALLAFGVAANLVLLVAAGGDPSFAVEPAYYAKAVDWDRHQAQARASAALGWQATLDVGPADRGSGLASVVARLADRDGAELAGVQVEIEAFHNARASQLVHAVLVEQAGPAYAARLPVVRAGLWEFRLTARRGADTFTAVLERDVPGWAR